ncbi:hypothetical protein JI752_012010 [Lysobacter sp. MMG2]|uniref:hypothetical protein n=1 Tax=Lysobacter sp. MMG2 TaxID=2801338 RepID=UPI001C238F23|nr:hypothetical protein [Lysobacter sp. MMG2]MBU8976868.1 hypothetical protein [Lysobacter sp. MMG2]
MANLFLFKVDHAFQLSGRPGPVLVPGIPVSPDLPAFGMGAKIRLILPTGESIDTQIAGVEMVNYGSRPRPERVSAPIALPPEISKDRVPQGTEVYLVLS